jgi:NAD(P)-dependent dehydrogenase (short-subunit alcohol dehydrogenase family)
MSAESSYSINFGLSGRVAVVTGSAQGIGQAVAAAMAHAGADVALIDLDEARLQDTGGRYPLPSTSGTAQRSGPPSKGSSTSSVRLTLSSTAPR